MLNVERLLPFRISTVIEMSLTVKLHPSSNNSFPTSLDAYLARIVNLHEKWTSHDGHTEVSDLDRMATYKHTTSFQPEKSSMTTESYQLN